MRTIRIESRKISYMEARRQKGVDSNKFLDCFARRGRAQPCSTPSVVIERYADRNPESLEDLGVVTPEAFDLVEQYDQPPIKIVLR